MCGLWWESSACLVAVGMLSRVTNRIGSPLSADQPAAGIAKAGLSAAAMITLTLVFPRAALAKRSISAARVYGSFPLIAAVRRPGGVGTLPTRMSWTPPAGPEPVGASTPSASLVADGSDEPPERRIGARVGGAINEAEANAACQLSVEASVTTAG